MPTNERRRPWFLPFLLLLFLTTWWSLWLAPYVREMHSPSFRVGMPARRTVVAPRRIVYIDPTLLKFLQQNSEPGASPFSPDTTLFLEHRSRFLSTLNVLTLLREAPYLTEEEKVQDLTRVEPLHLSPEEARALLSLPDESWSRIRDAALSLFVYMLQNPIPAQVSQMREILRQRLPLQLRPQEQMWVERLVLAYLLAYHRETPQGGAPVVRVYRPGEVIVRQGEVVDAATYEVLKELGLVVESRTLPDLLRRTQIHLFLLAAWAFVLFAYVLRTPRLWNLPTLLMLMGGFLLILAHLRLWFPLAYGIPWIPLAYPFALYPLLAHLFLGPWSGLMWGLPLIFSALVDHVWAAPLLMYHTMQIFAAFTLLNQPKGIFDYLKAAIGMAVAGTLMLAGHAPLFGFIGESLGSWLPLPIFYSMVTMGLAVFVEYSISWVTGRVTRLHLLDLVRPEHPLLQRLAEEAEGTYQHSLGVATLAEQAARAIGADAFLCRVGGLYHDIGKLKRPHFFIENQTPEVTVSMPADPYRMAQILKEHVFYGLQLAAKYRLPRRIRDFIAEHHGTTLVWVPYMKAVEAAGGDPSQVPLDAFMYPGPRPRSRETAILMLADICEARVRSQQPKTEEEIRTIVRDSIELRFREGELDLSGLSIRDLRLIEDAFVQVLVGMLHGRIKYPKAATAGKRAAAREARSRDEEVTLIAAPRMIPSNGREKDRHAPSGTGRT